MHRSVIALSFFNACESNVAIHVSLVVHRELKVLSTFPKGKWGMMPRINDILPTFCNKKWSIVSDTSVTNLGGSLFQVSSCMFISVNFSLFWKRNTLYSSGRRKMVMIDDKGKYTNYKKVDAASLRRDFLFSSEKINFTPSTTRFYRKKFYFSVRTTVFKTCVNCSPAAQSH